MYLSTLSVKNQRFEMDISFVTMRAVLGHAIGLFVHFLNGTINYREWSDTTLKEQGKLESACFRFMIILLKSQFVPHIIFYRVQVPPLFQQLYNSKPFARNSFKLKEVIYHWILIKFKAIKIISKTLKIFLQIQKLFSQAPWKLRIP